MKKIYVLICILFFTATGSFCFAQTPVVNSTEGNKTVKITTINKTFTCPVLTPRLINGLQKNCKAQNITIADDKNTLTFSMPENSIMNSDSIVKLATSAGFPAGYVIVEMEKK